VLRRKTATSGPIRRPQGGFRELAGPEPGPTSLRRGGSAFRPGSPGRRRFSPASRVRATCRGCTTRFGLRATSSTSSGRRCPGGLWLEAGSTRLHFDPAEPAACLWLGPQPDAPNWKRALGASGSSLAELKRSGQPAVLLRRTEATASWASALLGRRLLAGSGARWSAPTPSSPMP